MTHKPNCVSYRRVSTQKQVNEGEGLDIQLDRIVSYCDSHNLNLLPEGDFTDEGKSGSKESINRDGIMSLIEFCKRRNASPNPSSHIGHVIVDKVDRLSRNLFEQLFIEKQLLVQGVTILYSAQELLNSSDGMDGAMKNMMRQMMGAFAEYELASIKFRLGDGVRKKTRNGNKPTGRQPFGYMYDHRGRDTLVNSAEAKVVRDIFMLRHTGLSLRAIASRVDASCTSETREGFGRCNREKKFGLKAVYDILNNDYYLGVVTWDGKKVKGNHEPLVDRKMWDRIHGTYGKQMVV